MHNKRIFQTKSSWFDAYSFFLHLALVSVGKRKKYIYNFTEIFYFLKEKINNANMLLLLTICLSYYKKQNDKQKKKKIHMYTCA